MELLIDRIRQALVQGASPNGNFDPASFRGLRIQFERPASISRVVLKLGVYGTSVVLSRIIIGIDDCWLINDQNIWTLTYIPGANKGRGKLIFGEGVKEWNRAQKVYAGDVVVCC